MDVRCDKCGTEYEFDENRIGATGVTVKCTACGFVFKVRAPRKAPPRATTHIGKGPQGREWLVRKPDGQMIAFRELTTLQKWIVEGRIGREDEISKNGETWKSLGNILELEPFFSVYEKARTLNTLLDRDDGIELRGSEVLSADSPLPIPSVAPTPVAPSSSFPEMPPHRTQPPAPPPISSPDVKPTVEMNAPSAPTAPTPAYADTVERTIPPSSDADRTAPIPPPNSGANGHPNGNGSAMSVRPAPTSDWATGLPGPGADDSGPSEIGEPTDFYTDAGLPAPKSSRLAWVVAFILLGLVGGVALAIYGPTGNNPVKDLAVKYGLIAAPPVDDDSTQLVESAHRTADLDTISELQKAENLLNQARLVRKGDPQLRADRALVLATEAAAFVRWKGDLERAAKRSEATVANWEAEIAALKGRRRKKSQPPRPVVPDPAALRKRGTEKIEIAKSLIARAKTEMQAAEGEGLKGLDVARSRAAIALAEGDRGALKTQLAEAKSLIESSGQTDPASLYIEAAGLIGDPEHSVESNLSLARVLLQQAITVRPTMNRARVLLARVHLLDQQTAPALDQLTRVLASASTHKEAGRLKDLAHALVTEKREKAERLVDAPPPTKAPPPKAPTTKVAPRVSPPTKKAPRKEPTTYAELMRRGDRLRERDRASPALNAYQRAGELKPASAEPLTGQGWCYLDLDQPHVALATFRRALKLNSRYLEAQYGVAESHRALGNKPEAIEAFERYLERAGPRSPDRRAAEKQLEMLKATAG